MIGSKPKPKVGISACLLGCGVRYDGGNKRQAWLVRALGKAVTFIPVCPELECGLGVPREPMRLTGNPASPRLVVIRTGKDVTAQMRRWMRRRLDELEGQNPCGFVFKSKSPSCGVRDVGIFDKRGKPLAKGAGLFARAFRCRFAGAPVADEQRLQDAKKRRAFINRVLGYG